MKLRGITDSGLRRIKAFITNVVYHSTDPKFVDIILREGLKIGRSMNYTKSGVWAQEFYGTNPIYVSLIPDKYEGVVFEVDVTGYRLYADLPSLVDMGAYIEEDGTIWWEVSPPGFDEEYTMEDILEDVRLSEKCINLTDTAAILENIPVDRLKLVN